MPMRMGCPSGIWSRFTVSWKSVSITITKAPICTRLPTRTCACAAMAAPWPMDTSWPISSRPRAPVTRCDCTGRESRRKRSPISMRP